MTGNKEDRAARAERELNYYRREYNDLGARVLRLQEEQSRAFREARRSRTVAKLIREAYRLIDSAATPDEIGNLMAEIVVDNTLCDRVAILRQLPEGNKFIVTHALGFASDPAPVSLVIAPPPNFFFTTAQTKLEPPAYELTEILRVPYVLWSFDPGSGYAMIIGNHSEGNVSRPFEAGDQELIEGTLSVYIDVMLRKQAEMELKTTKAEADRANQLQSRFLATFSHELRTPLNAIIGFSEMMISLPLKTEKYGEYAHHIHDASDYLLSLINEILDYSKLDLESVELDEQLVDVIDIIYGAIEAVQSLADNKEIRISLNVIERIPAVRVDPLRMRQIVTNILGNAIKFSPSGSLVTITIQRPPLEQGIIIEVEDRGIGISEADLKKVLEPFFQVGGGYAGPSEGTGLGLSISKALMEAHEGRISIRSTLGKGTTVGLFLPEHRVSKSTRRENG